MTLKETVYNLLLTNSETRDSDKKLIWLVWSSKEFVDYIDNTITKDSFMSATSPESCRRVRQQLQREDLLLGKNLIQPTKSVKEKRVKLAKSKGFEYQEGKFEFDPITNSYKQQ